MKTKLALGLAFFLISLPAHTEDSPKLLVTETSLTKMIYEKSPGILSAEATYLNAETAQANYRDKFALSLDAQASYQYSDEKAIAVFVPVFGPSHFYSMGLSKDLGIGTRVSAGFFSDQRSTNDGTIQNATRSGVNVMATVDLWKNFLGRLDSMSLNRLALQQDQARIQRQLESRGHELEIRKMYWSLVANNEVLKIYEELHKTAEKQYREAKQRRRNSVADASEVARFGAQLASRDATISKLQYDKAILIEGLKRMVPGLENQQVELGPYDLPAKVGEFLQCTGQIKLQKKLPWDQTPIDEMVKAIEEAYGLQRKITDTHDSLDISLSTELQQSGVDSTYEDSFNDLNTDRRLGYQVGIQVSIPIDGKKARTERVKELAEEKIFLAQRQQFLLQLKSQHQQITHLVGLLDRAVRQQNENSKMLEISLKDMKRKYRQARVSVVDLVNEQDSLLQSLITEVDIKLNMIHVLLNYFKVFPDSPCKINKVI